MIEFQYTVALLTFKSIGIYHKLVYYSCMKTVLYVGIYIYVAIGLHVCMSVSSSARNQSKTYHE